MKPGFASEPFWWYDRLSLALYTGMIALVLFTLPDYGMSWDEAFRWKAGQEKLIYYETLLSGESAEILGSKPDLYPGLFDLSVALVNEFTSLGLLLSGHSLSALFGLLAILAAWKIARFLGNPRVAFWTLLFLILTPRFYGHLFFNPKDIPFAATYLWATYGLLRTLPSLPRPTWRQSLVLGVLIGLCMATRFVGIIQIGFAGLAAIIAFVVDVKIRRLGLHASLKDLGQLITKGIGLILTAFATLLPFWPYAQWRPMEAFFGTARASAHYGWNAPVFYLGESIPAKELPWHYFPTWLAVSTPLVVLVLFAIGVVFAMTAILRKSSTLPRSSQVALLAFVAFFPPVFAIAKGSTIYDGLRHFLFVLPFIAIIAALAFDHLLHSIQRFGKFASTLPVFLVLATLVPVGLQMIRLHPYQYTFFNQLTGGLAGAKDQFETDYWALSFRESIEQLDQGIESGTIGVPEGPLKIHIDYLPIVAKLFAPPDWIAVDDPKAADFRLITTRVKHYSWDNESVVVSTDREGATFSVILKANHSTETIQADEDGAGGPKKN